MQLVATTKLQQQKFHKMRTAAIFSKNIRLLPTEYYILIPRNLTF